MERSSMSNTKRTVNRKPKRKKRMPVKSKATQQKKGEILGVIICGLGLFTLLSIYTQSTGRAGDFIEMLLRGLFGIAVYAMPFLIMLWGISIIIFSHNQLSLYKILTYSGILFALVGIIHLFYLKYFISDDVWAFIKSSWEMGLKGKGGGASLALFIFGFLSLFGVLGSYLFYIIMLTIGILILTNLSLKEVGQTIYDRYQEEKQKANENRKIKKEKLSKAKKTKRKGDNKTNTTEDLLPETEEIKIIDFERSKDKITEIKEEKNTLEEPEPLIVENLAIQEATNDKPYIFPPLHLLNQKSSTKADNIDQQSTVKEKALRLEETLSSFGINVKVHQVSCGPAITRFELQATKGIKLSKFTNLADDIALNLAVPSVRIAPIPGKTAIGIEVPNGQVKTVLAGEIIASQPFKSFSSDLAFPLGMDLSGNVVVADIGKMPHVLIAGATGSGKSVCINSLIIGILYKASPEDVKMIMIDPKVVELNQYNGIPHLLIPVVTDPKKAAGALNWAVQEMTTRYDLFAKENVKDITRFNQVAENRNMKKLPKIIVIIDELADLMMVAAKEVEDAICRLAQMARAAGIYLVIATQRPSVDIITGVIKANIPSRIAFAVSSLVDSRTILDGSGAEKLLGKGDMLYHPSGKPKPIRVQGTFIKETEIEAVVSFIKGCYDTSTSMYDESLIDTLNSNPAQVDKEKTDEDPLLVEAVRTILDTGHASVSLLQRKLRVGYARAARLIDQMESRGYISGFEGSKPRKVLVTEVEYQQILNEEEKK